MIAPGIAPRLTLHARDARVPGMLVTAQRVHNVFLARKTLRQHGGILDRHRAPLGEKRQHRVGGIPEQRNWSLRADALRRSIKQRPFLPAVGQRDQRARGGCKGFEALAELDRLATRGPAHLMPVVTHDRDDVDLASYLDRIMDEMRIAPEPQA